MERSGKEGKERRRKEERKKNERGTITSPNHNKKRIKVWVYKRERERERPGMGSAVKIKETSGPGLRRRGKRGYELKVETKLKVRCGGGGVVGDSEAVHAVACVWVG